MDVKKMRACLPLLPEPGDKVVGECLDEIERLEAEIAAMKTKTYCAYCGKEYAIDTDAALVSEHIATCAKHPMRAVEADVESLRRELTRYYDKLAAADAEVARLQMRTMDPARLVRVAKALESWLAGSHFTIGDPMAVAISVLEAADEEAGS